MGKYGNYYDPDDPSTWGDPAGPTPGWGGQPTSPATGGKPAGYSRDNRKVTGGQFISNTASLSRSRRNGSHNYGGASMPTGGSGRLDLSRPNAGLPSGATPTDTASLLNNNISLAVGRDLSSSIPSGATDEKSRIAKYIERIQSQRKNRPNGWNWGI